MTSQPSTRARASEAGIAMILAIFMVLVLSVLGSSLMFVAQTETFSSLNYRLTAQARYGAESGVHKAANFLLYSYTAPGGVGDPLTGYNIDVSPVTAVGNGDPVVLSSDDQHESNYPVNDVQTAFEEATTDTLEVQDGTVTYTAYARLMGMRQIADILASSDVTIQIWHITGIGRVDGARNTTVEVSAIVERQVSPWFNYAAFATYPGCESLSFAGGATTSSYDSTAPLVGGVPNLANTGGNVGTNGNLTEVGDPTIVNGTLSSPRAGVGECTSNNVTAQTVSGMATVSGGLVELPQALEYPTPPAPNPLPPTTNLQFTQAGGCPAGVDPPAACATSAGGATITPGSPSATITMGNVALAGNTTLRLHAGTYVVNSLDIIASAQIIIETGPVIFQIAGTDVTTPLRIEGDGISNPSFVPENLRFIYAGTANVQVAGGTNTAALLYAPNATGAFAGGADWYGAVIVKRLTATGGVSLHYDRRLQVTGVTAGNYMMSAFTWKTF